MSETFREIKKCVRNKVKEFCFAHTLITGDKIGSKKIKELGLELHGGMPGVTPYDGLAASLRSCSSVTINTLTGEKLKELSDMTVDDLARFILAELLILKGEV